MKNTIINYYDKNNKRYEVKRNGEFISFKIKDKKYKFKVSSGIKEDEVINFLDEKIKILLQNKYDMANDFKLLFSGVKNELKLYSENLKREIYIPVNDFVTFLNKNKISKESESLDDILFGINIIVDENEKIHVEKEFINKDFYQEGLNEGQSYIYNGEEVIYLGERYMSTLFENKYISFERISKIKKKQFMLKNSKVVELKEELIKIESKKILSKIECSELLHIYYIKNLNITYFSKKDIAGTVKYGFINFKECDSSPFAKINGSYYTKVQNSKNLKESSLFEKYILFTKNAFYFKLDLKGKSFNYVEAVQLNIEGIEEVNLQRIGIIS